MKIKNWKAKRSGGRITLTGVDVATGQPFKLANIDTIVSAPGSTAGVATHRDGQRIDLA